MSEKRGCFKTGCLGCLGAFLVAALLVGVLVLVGYNSSRVRDIQDQQLTPIEASAGDDSNLTVPDIDWRRYPGKVILDLSQGSFILNPAPEGEGLSARAKFDAEAYTITENFTIQPDSTWVYKIHFFRHMKGSQALFRSLFMHGDRPLVQVFLPSDVPLTVDASISEGGMEADLGGLWLKDVDFNYGKGGFSVVFSKPLREPMNRLSIHGAMGGTEVGQVGNASPAVLDVRCRMGGGDIDLSGMWLRDCQASFSVRMGGISVTVPKGVAVDGAMIAGPGMVASDRESPLPVLHLSKQQSMGEVEFQR